jgi:hypothetical protein
MLEANHFGYSEPMHKRFILASIAAIIVLGTATLAFAFPGSTACALIEFSGLETLHDGTRIQPSSTNAERQAILEIQTQAKTRIENMFGAPRAKPLVVFLNNPATIFTFKSNGYGSTHFVGPRVCVIFGPQGTNVDVVAHELLHAELSERVGSWRRFSEIPAWFDEGVAMQVDYRSRYDSSQAVDATELASVQMLKTNDQFNVGNDEEITRHYARSKRAVAQWLEKIGRSNLYVRLERIRAGESLDSVLGP